MTAAVGHGVQHTNLLSQTKKCCKATRTRGAQQLAWRSTHLEGALERQLVGVLALGRLVGHAPKEQLLDLGPAAHVHVLCALNVRTCPRAEGALRLLLVYAGPLLACLEVVPASSVTRMSCMKPCKVQKLVRRQAAARLSGKALLP